MRFLSSHRNHFTEIQERRRRAARRAPPTRVGGLGGAAWGQGTRVSVAVILGALAGGMEVQEAAREREERFSGGEEISIQGWSAIFNSIKLHFCGELSLSLGIRKGIFFFHLCPLPNSLGRMV